jgi:hypothetical protein
MRNTYQQLDENTEGRGQLSKIFVYMRNNITTHSKEAGLEIVGWGYQVYGSMFQRHASR